MVFQVEITEILQRVINVEADNEIEAMLLAKQSYTEEKYALDYSDHVDTTIDIYKDG